MVIEVIGGLVSGSLALLMNQLRITSKNTHVRR
jgi:Co/Zn/Cd efflux system component